MRLLQTKGGIDLLKRRRMSLTTKSYHDEKDQVPVSKNSMLVSNIFSFDQLQAKHEFSII